MSSGTEPGATIPDAAASDSLFYRPDECPDTHLLVDGVNALHRLQQGGNLILVNKGEGHPVDLGPGVGAEVRHTGKGAHPFHIVPLVVTPDAKMLQRILHLFSKSEVVYNHYCFHDFPFSWFSLISSRNFISLNATLCFLSLSPWRAMR